MRWPEPGRSASGAFRRAAGIVALAIAGVALLVHWAPALVLAAEPTPSGGTGGGDPRSAGEGPGLVGDPLFAIGVVALIGLVALLATLAYVRATAGRDGTGG
jgi:hypothetical protein